MHLLPLTGPELDSDAIIALYRIEPGQPLVRMNFVSSIDGAVAVDGLSGGLGTGADKEVFVTLRALADGILVGAGTLRDENYRPVRPTAERRAWRESVGLPACPRLVVVSGGLDLDPTHRALAEAPVRPVVITRASSDPSRREALSDVADVLVHGDDQVDLTSALAALRGDYALNHLLCEGGPTLFGSLHAAGLVDEVCLTVSPLLAGPGAGRIIAGPQGALTTMALVHALASEGALLLRYRRS